MKNNKDDTRLPAAAPTQHSLNCPPMFSKGIAPEWVWIETKMSPGRASSRTTHSKGGSKGFWSVAGICVLVNIFSLSVSVQGLSFWVHCGSLALWGLNIGLRLWKE